MRFDKWWNGLKHDDTEEGYVYRLAEQAWDLAFELGEMVNNEMAYDDGYNQGHHDALVEMDLKEIKEEAFKDGHSQGHAAGMKASLRELL
jgi:hypothetical protein